MTIENRKALRPITIFALTQVVLILAFAGLLGGSTWRSDEYDTLARYQQEGVAFLWHRLSRWSPRPFSELLIFGYATVVNLTHMQLIPHLMALMWGGLLLSISASGIWFRSTLVPATIRLLPISLPLVLTLISAKTGEIFYWPFGSMAYMPTLSALLVMLAILTWGNSRDHWLAWGTCGVIAAGASEMGAFFVLFFAGILSMAYATRNPTFNTILRQWLKPLIPAVLVSVCVLIGLTAGRLGNTDEAKFGPNISHNLMAVLEATAPESARQLLGKGNVAGWAITPYALLKVCLGLFVFSLMSTLRRVNSQRSVLFAFGLACLITIIFTIFAAYYQFGVPCCERHDTVRYFLSLLTVTAISIAAFGGHENKPSTQGLSKLCIVTGIVLALLSIAGSINKLVPDYQNLSQIIKLHADNWLFDQKPPYVFLNNEIKGRALGTLPMPADGIFHNSDKKSPISNSSVLRFFGAETIEFRRIRHLKDPIPINHIPVSIRSDLVNLEMSCTADLIKIELFSENQTKTTQLNVAGWLNLPDTKLNQAKVTLLLHVTGDTPTLDAYFALERSDRPDVAAHFQRKDLLQSGYTTQVRVPFEHLQSISILATDGLTSARCKLVSP